MQAMRPPSNYTSTLDRKSMDILGEPFGLTPGTKIGIRGVSLYTFDKMMEKKAQLADVRRLLITRTQMPYRFLLI